MLHATFKGTGAAATNTPTDDAHRSIKGKKLIVMSTNIGYDVSHNQFGHYDSWWRSWSIQRCVAKWAFLVLELNMADS
jgi:hypothetical protein